MPGRGGRREGRPGTQYPNRADLRTAKPIKLAPSPTYGATAALERVQQQLPASTAPATAAASPSPAGDGGPRLPAGFLAPLDGPSARPGEPVTAGIDLGPGPGSEVLPQAPEGTDPDLAGLVRHLPMLELLANLPSSSSQTRNIVRRLRALVPSDIR